VGVITTNTDTAVMATVNRWRPLEEVVNSHDFEISPELKERGVSRMAQEGTTFLIQFNSRPIRFDIDPKSWNNTVVGYHKYAKRLITDEDLRYKIEYYLADQYITFLENGNGHASSSSSNNNDDSSNIEDEDSRTIAQKTLDLAEANYSDLFVDQFGSPYAAVRIGEHIETLPLKSSRFKNWLCRLFYESEHMVPFARSPSPLVNCIVTPVPHCPLIVTLVGPGKGIALQAVLESSVPVTVNEPPLICISFKVPILFLSSFGAWWTIKVNCPCTPPANSRAENVIDAGSDTVAGGGHKSSPSPCPLTCVAGIGCGVGAATPSCEQIALLPG
jgi:hypothetical protein